MTAGRTADQRKGAQRKGPASKKEPITIHTKPHSGRSGFGVTPRRYPFSLAGFELPHLVAAAF